MKLPAHLSQQADMRRGGSASGESVPPGSGGF